MIIIIIFFLLIESCRMSESIRTIRRNSISTIDESFKISNDEWLKIVGPTDKYFDLVQKVLDEHIYFSLDLAFATNRNGQSAIDLAGRPLIHNLLLKSTYFFRRYEFTTKEPIYKSATSIVYYCTGNNNNNNNII